MRPELLLDVANLACERDGRMLFDDLHVQLRAGECMELRGPNGSGKSTLLRAIAGLYPDYTGTIQAAESLYLGHRPGISGLLTAEENLRWYAMLRPGGRSPGAALTAVGMEGYERVACQQLSAGQLRRVALARLLLCPSLLWLLDEPMTALDSDGHGLVRPLVASPLSAGGAALCATHQGLGLAGSSAVHLGAEASQVVASPAH
jgi:heme exporter protein A